MELKNLAAGVAALALGCSGSWVDGTVVCEEPGGGDRLDFTADVAPPENASPAASVSVVVYSGGIVQGEVELARASSDEAGETWTGSIDAATVSASCSDYLESCYEFIAVGANEQEGTGSAGNPAACHPPDSSSSDGGDGAGGSGGGGSDDCDGTLVCNDGTISCTCTSCTSGCCSGHGGCT